MPSVLGLGFRAQGSEFRVQGFGYGVASSGALSFAVHAARSKGLSVALVASFGRRPETRKDLTPYC